MSAQRVLLFGTFDGLHPGHRFVIDSARERGSVTVVVARDATVARLKGRPAVDDEEGRCAALRAAYPDITVILGDASDFSAPLRSVRPDRIVMGYDQRLPPGVKESDFPCPVERLPAFHPEHFKSSKLRGREA